ncbi:TPA: hypothetical protein ACHYEI_004551, partial [Yersinia enterocolitica]
NPPRKLTSTVNIPKNIYAVICSGKATYAELQNDLSVRDMFNLLEVIAVEAHNSVAWRQHMEKPR